MRGTLPEDAEIKAALEVYQDDDFQLMMCSALRYALGRHTYMVQATTDYLIDKLVYFSDKTLDVMREDIKSYFTDIVPLGNEHDCDIAAWTAISKRLNEEFQKRKGNK